LVSAANRNGIQLISVVFDSTYMWNDSIALLNYGFPQLKPIELVKKGSVVQSINVSSGKKDTLQLKALDTIIIPVADGERDKFTTEIAAPSKITATIHKGDHVGKIKVLYDGKEIASTDLIAAETIDKKSFFSLIWQKIFLTMNYLKQTFV